MNKIEIIKRLGKSKIDEMMDEDKYWSLIQDSIYNSNNQEEQEQFLQSELNNNRKGDQDSGTETESKPLIRWEMNWQNTSNDLAYIILLAII